jgi:hypothetical protein
MNVKSPEELGLAKNVDAECFAYLCQKFKKLQKISQRGGVKSVRQKVYAGSEKDPTNMRMCVNGRNESKTTEWRRKNGEDVAGLPRRVPLRMRDDGGRSFTASARTAAEPR